MENIGREEGQDGVDKRKEVIRGGKEDKGNEGGIVKIRIRRK